MRWVYVGAVLAAFFLPLGAWAADIAPEYADLDKAILQVAEYLEDYLPQSSLQSLWQGIKSGDAELNWQLPGKLAAEVFAKEIVGAAALLMQLLVPVLFGMLLGSLAQGGVGRLTALIIGLAAAVPAVKAFAVAGAAAEAAVNLMSDFLYALLPVLLTLLAAMGGGSAVALFNPALLFAVSVALHLLRVFVLPMLYVSGALAVGGRLGGGLKLGGLARLTRDLAMGVFGIMLTVFTGLLGVLGLSSAVVGGLGLRAVKSAGGAFIPVVGHTLMDALDSVLGTTLLLKNIIGVGGVLMLLLICILPGIKILLLYAVFRLVAALAEPLGDTAMCGLLNDMAGVVVLFFAVTAAAGLFFFFLISITIGMGNIMLMVR